MTWAAVCLLVPGRWLGAANAQTLSHGGQEAKIRLVGEGDLRTYELSTTADLRDDIPAGKRLAISEADGQPTIRTGNLLFDGLYAMAIAEARANSVPRISDGAYAQGQPIAIEAFQTGESWSYVWTRDLAYSLDLGLAGFDPERSVNSLLFKASERKPSVKGGVSHQIVQDTGSGGSYPVSTDRAVWALGAHATLKSLTVARRAEFLERIHPILCGTIEQDRVLVFDQETGLYRGEHSFLDWREQTYPGWTKDEVLAIAMSKALSVNAAMYFLLSTTADYARMLGETERQSRFAEWAEALRKSIDRHLLDATTGLYRTYLLSSDGSHNLPADRYDLLGLSLAILLGVADEERAKKIIATYPTGPHGPPVVWPQERTVDIYHNQGIWPFVTAYWIKAARQAGNAGAVDAGILSLYREAALNLSHMENFDFRSGRAYAEDGSRKGPAVNSRRQLWSVAGYMSMVQDVVFGLETSLEGIRFRPYVTAALRKEMFGGTDAVEWRGFIHGETRNTVRVHLPPVGSFSEGAAGIERVEFNGKLVKGEFVGLDALQPENVWEIFLRPSSGEQKSVPVKVVDVSDERTLFSPVTPVWKGLFGRGGRVGLSFGHEDAENVTFNIYRDGELYAREVRQLQWVDPEPGDLNRGVHSYAIAAVDRLSGTVSHPTPSRAHRSDVQRQVIPATALKNRGGNLVNDHHFENWGKPDHELVSEPFQIHQSGKHVVRVEFSNGAGPVNTGITCAVKKLEIRRASSGETVASGYLVMPQSGDWNRWDLSSPVPATFEPGERYTIRISADEYSRNMSYLKSNASYMAHSGGGDDAYNFVNIASVQLLYVEPPAGR